LHALQAAALGDYGDALADLRSLRYGLRDGHNRLKQHLQEIDRRLVTFAPGLLCGLQPFAPAITARALAPYLEQKNVLQVGEPTFRAQQADTCVIEGLLALELGDTDAARSAFTLGQQLCTEPPGAVVPFAGGPIAGCYLGKLSAQH
jgi:hypothetical protein